MFPHENSLAPVFLWRDGAPRPEQIGTGIYLKLAERSYLFTAGHVLDHASEGALCVPTREGVTPIAGWLATNLLAPSQRRGDDRLDIGYVRFDDEHENERHPDLVHLSRGHVDLFEDIRPGEFFSIGGYPLTRGRHAFDTLSSEAYSYVGISAEPDDYRRLGYDPRLHVLVRYHIKKGIFPDGERVTPPHPRGLSGGGIFRLSVSFLDDLVGEPRRLVASMHTFLKRENMFVGTRILVYLTNLSARYPHEVRAFVEA